MRKNVGARNVNEVAGDDGADDFLLETMPNNNMINFNMQDSTPDMRSRQEMQHKINTENTPTANLNKISITGATVVNAS